MDDKQIINLFFQRDEDAINAVDEKYGSKLNALAANMLQSREDGLECVNDTYMKAWNSIPPARPEYLFAFLAASARNIAIDMIRKNNAGKGAPAWAQRQKTIRKKISAWAWSPMWTQARPRCPRGCCTKAAA